MLQRKAYSVKAMYWNRTVEFVVVANDLAEALTNADDEARKVFSKAVPMDHYRRDVKISVKEK